MTKNENGKAPPQFTAWLLCCLCCFLMGCTSLNPKAPRPISESFMPLETSPLQEWSASLKLAPGISAFHLITSGRDALAARLALIDQASSSIDMQYYMLRDDSSTQLIIHQLLQAADRGVRVRLLVDDIFGLKRDHVLATLSAHPNIEIRVFNPFLARGQGNPLRFFEFLQKSSLNKRMHNKLLVVDNSALVVGGRNLGNEYFDSEAETEFNDVDVLVMGPVVFEASESFDEYWNHQLAVPVRAFLRDMPTEEHLESMRFRLQKLMSQLRSNNYQTQFSRSRLAEDISNHQLLFRRGRARMLYDRPEKVMSEVKGLFKGVHIAAELYPAIARTKKDVLLVSAYFVPGPRLRELLEGLVASGVRVRVLTNSLAATDVAYVHGAYSRWRGPLINAGVEMYEMRPVARKPVPSFRLIGRSLSSLHAKALILDSRQVFIGSMNLDQRSVYLNTETGILIDSPELAADLRASFERMMLPDLSYEVFADKSEPGRLLWWGRPDGKDVILARDPEAGFWKRWKAAFLGKILPERML
ncbi:putative cardiolipin synthase [Fluviicoccus keumensis]|uniref:Putative cardiolipin synthase n=2 Tax=Fluviicoccus keumensis TaxID=1435465 RepID=A0A4Q7YIQ1_9GAMM|nr:putative cardiolipin synthase [Fluviicoccus keumensis]